MIYIAANQYAPSTASTNRIMAYVRAFSELGVDATVCFFMPNTKYSKVEKQYEHISFQYLWDKRRWNYPILRQVSLFLSIWCFKKILKKDDDVFVYGFADLVVALGGIKGINVYNEFTEHPEAAFTNHLPRTTIPRFLHASAMNKGVFVISTQLKQFFINNGCHSDCVHVINMIVDTSRFDGVLRQETEPYIAYCGNVSNDKDGVDILIKAFAQIVDRFPMYRLYIIGKTPTDKQKFDNLELTRRLGIEDKVVFTGVVTPERMPQILKNAKALALARPDNLQSQYGFPTKLGEYLLTGNPVIITRVGDLPLFLKDEESAFIAEPGDVQDFAAKMIRAIDCTELSQSVGEKGRQVAIESFNYSTETKKIIDIIQRRLPF